MHGSTKGPRVLLKRLREAMAEPLGPQEQLDRIVQQIAANMVAEVCSVYVLREDDVLELFATQGLNPDAVHLSSLKVGEGLVGTIAANGRILNLEQAQTHPEFAYLPETGEELYSSFLGVPMRRAGRALGVLVVQNKAPKKYADEDVEALETAAMVLSDLVASGSLEGITPTGRQLDFSRPVSVTGTRLAAGIGLGHVVLHEPKVVVKQLFNDDPETELARLHEAIDALRSNIDRLVSRGDLAREGDHKDILESYRMFAHDRGWLKRMEAAIADGLTAEGAAEKVQLENRSRLMRSADDYLRERVHDFDDLSRRLLKQLMGGSAFGATGEVPENAIILARNMGAAELLDYDRSHLVGLVIEQAAPTSHVVIVARALGLAVVGQVRGFIGRAEKGDEIIVDGDEGSVHLRPADDLKEAYVEKVQFRARKQQRFAALRDTPSVSKDGVAVDLMLNAGLSMDLPHLSASGAAGVGLFRTELQFMLANSLPRADEQEIFYRGVLDAAGGKPVIFRTLDVGGDKVLPYLRKIKEDNPALGWRAIRLSIDRPGLLRIQFRALLRAAAGRELRIKLPMITEAQEIDSVRTILDTEIELQKKFGYDAPSRVLLGSMVEVPGLLWQLDELMAKVDFVSVGSNDLFQFMVASDRTNAFIANRYNPLSRPFLRALRSIVEAGKRNGTPVHLCGELAGDPITALALFAIGYRSISMPPASIGPVKEMLISLDVSQAEKMVAAALEETAATRTMNEILIDFADQYGVPV